MTDKMELKNVFYALVIPFLIFFTCFAAFIYPHRALVHPHALVDLLSSHLPANFAAPLAIVRNWSFALFYVMAELWGSVVASLLFWGFANEVTTVDEAKKYYPLFGLGANVALIVSGQYVKWVSNMRRTLAPGVDAWAVSLQYLMGAVLGSGGVLLLTYKYLQDKVVSKNTAMKSLKKFPAKKRVKMTMKESAKFLLSSKYIRDLAILVISYGMCINIVEVSWKAKLKQAFPDPNSYSAFSKSWTSRVLTRGVAVASHSSLTHVIFFNSSGKLLVGDGGRDVGHDAAGPYHLLSIRVEDSRPCDSGRTFPRGALSTTDVVDASPALNSHLVPISDFSRR